MVDSPYLHESFVVSRVHVRDMGPLHFGVYLGLYATLPKELNRMHGRPPRVRNGPVLYIVRCGVGCPTLSYKLTAFYPNKLNNNS